MCEFTMDGKAAFKSRELPTGGADDYLRLLVRKSCQGAERDWYSSVVGDCWVLSGRRGCRVTANPGNHYDLAVERIAAGIAWLLSR